MGWCLVGVAMFFSPAGSADSRGQLDPGYRINVNAEDPATLRLLPGVGPSIAENIVATRQQLGPFAEPADLEKVHRIGPVLSKRIAPWVVFGPATDQ